LSFSTALGVDLVRLLTQGGDDSLGIVVDATATLPLLRGAGREIATEDLTQSERETVYAIWNFERFKRTFAVLIASDYLGVLQSMNRLGNAAENYRSLIASTNRARRLADAGRLPEIQFDQSVQQELTARSRWISARAAYEAELDSFKITLGLPPDARVELDAAELDRLALDLVDLAGPALEGPRVVPPADREVVLEPPAPLTGTGLEMEEADAVDLALENRLDLSVALARVDDAERKITVAASSLKPGLDLTLSAAAGEGRSLATAGSPDAKLDPDQGNLSALLSLELPFERTAERNVYRESVLDYEKSLRTVEEVSDSVRQQVRARLRDLLLARETVSIQAQAVAIARRRVDSTDLFLQAGRAEIRDVLESQEALLTALNGLTGSYIDYRLSELRLQRDMGVLHVDEKGLWTEYQPVEVAP